MGPHDPGYIGRGCKIIYSSSKAPALPKRSGCFALDATRSRSIPAALICGRSRSKGVRLRIVFVFHH